MSLDPIGLWLGVAFVQAPEGRVYVLHSAATGACQPEKSTGRTTPLP
jgi:hypothetical protein